jgi:RsiW-degrading membrane proteinase PrsW (M82 family)
MILLNLALLPVFLIIIYFYKRDKFEREPLYLTFQTFILGFMLVFPAIFFEKLLTGLFQDTYFNFITFFLYIFIGVSLVEEGLKFAILYIFNLPKKDFNEPYDGIFYAVIVSLGFAAIENILYVFQRGAIVGILRAFTAVPAHTIFAVFMGFFTGVYKFTGKKIFVFLSLIIPMLLHTIYDMIAMSRMSYGFFTLFLFIIFFVIFSLFLMQKQISKSPFRILR